MSLADRVAALPWYHRIDLPGVMTPGAFPIAPRAYRLPARMDGLHVLDVGAGDGYWTFECLKRGAARVLAIDDLSDPTNLWIDHSGAGRDAPRRDWAQFDLCKEAFGYGNAVCQRRTQSVYDLTPADGMFDLICFFGVLYHCRHPLLALDRLRRVSCGDIYVESAILDDFSPYRGGPGHGYPDQMVMEFYPRDEYGAVHTNWWVPTILTLAHMTTSAGWRYARAWKLSKAPESLGLCRGFVRGSQEEIA